MKTASAHRLLRLVLLIFCAFCGFFLLWLALNVDDPGEFCVSFYQESSPKVRENIRVVYLSDLHLAEFGEENAALIAQIKKLAPDLIAIGGDLTVYGCDDHRVALALCRKLPDIAPVFYAMGNHEFNDINLAGSDIDKELAATGVTLLHDRFVSLELKGTTLTIGGLTEYDGAVPLYSGDFLERYSAAEGYKLLLSHYPSNFHTNLRDVALDLVLAGHTHGGMINIPYVFDLYAQEHWFASEYWDGEHKMIVGRGLGNSSWAPRINNPPELVVVDIDRHS